MRIVNAACAGRLAGQELVEGAEPGPKRLAILLCLFIGLRVVEGWKWRAVQEGFAANQTASSTRVPPKLKARLGR